MSNLSDIVNVQIDVRTPVVDSASFDTMLIVGPGPADTSAPGYEPPPDVGVYTSLKEVTDAGWVASGESVDPIGLAAVAAFSQSSQPAKIYIAVQKKVGETLEPVTTTLDRALNYPGWYAVAPAGIAETDFQAIATWVEANEKLFAYTTMATTNPVDLTLYRSFGIYGKTSTGATSTPESNKYAHVAWLAKCLGYDAGSETWALKTLATISPSTLSGTEMNTLKAQKINYYVTYAGRNVTQLGQTCAGEWIDVIRFRDWLKNDMQLRVFNLLVLIPKIPYTNARISLVQNQMLASLKQGQANGGIAEDEFDEDGNVIVGYTVTVPNAANISDTDKASRILSGCKFTARLAGAIHVTNIQGSLVY